MLYGEYLAPKAVQTKGKRKRPRANRERPAQAPRQITREPADIRTRPRAAVAPHSLTFARRQRHHRLRCTPAEHTRSASVAARGPSP